jgi:hypothetical protein
VYIPPASHQSDRIAQSSHNWHRGAIYANDVTGYSRDVTLTLLNSWKGIRSVLPANLGGFNSICESRILLGEKFFR